MERLGQQVVVDNRAGANGIIGSELASKANPDGHTLLLMTTSNTMTPAIYKLPYDPIRSFAPVAMLGTSPLALVVNVAIPAGSVKELVELARTKPGGFSYATAGAGGVNHFAAELFSRSTNIRMLHVPYKGGAPALTDVIAGQVNLMFGTLPLTLRHIQGGKVRGLGVTGSTRSPMMPELPTIAEAGVPGFELHIWWGLAAPAGTPEPIVARLNAEVGSILGQAEAAKRLENEGAEARPMSAAAFSKLIHIEIEKWGRVAREAGIKAQ